MWIDTAAARRAGRRWTFVADDLHRRAFELEHTLVALALDQHQAAAQHLTEAATELWQAATFARRVADAVDAADGSFHPGDPVAVARLVARSRPDVTRPFSSAFGERGGTGRSELRSPYGVTGRTPIERARSLLERALADTADQRQIRADEFEVVRLDTGRFVVVLPGVVDLSSPDPGWHEHHRSVRDLDRAAFESARSTGLDGNHYARLVHTGLAGVDVPAGAELLLVGHSFGADTALDLAADPAFNGPSGYRVTHVLAAGYHSGPQLGAVPGSTSVLVVQNRRDVPVIAEAVGAAHVTDVVAEQAAALRSLAAGDHRDAVRHQASTARHQAGVLWAAGRHLVDRADDVGRVAVGAAVGAPHEVHRGLTDLLTLEPGVSSPAPGQVVSVFDGGGDGFGHHQSHYVDHLRRIDDPAVTTFLASLDRAGYTAPGEALAVDVSVPG